MASARLVCVVDDAADYRFLLQQLFSRFFSTYRVRFFASGRALLVALPDLEQRPSLILLDRHMPDFDGHQTLLHLKQHTTYRTIPIVMMSADATSVEVDGCYEAGVNSFLFKSIDFHSLKETMTAVCQYWLELNLESVNQ